MADLHIKFFYAPCIGGWQGNRKISFHDGQKAWEK